MNRMDFDKFLEAARRGRSEPPAQAPFGFSTRVAALSTGIKPDHLAPWEHLARWGASVAALVALISILLGQGQAPPNPLAELAREAEAVESDW